tara:strand:- start:9793 stop:10701 length:909 start_codon:yes stop_codon:yes gene_type:complete
MQNKLTKDEVLNHFNILYDDLPRSIQLQLDKFFPIQYNELNSEQYNEYYELCLEMLNKKLEVDWQDDWFSVLQNLRTNNDNVKSIIRPKWFRKNAFVNIQNCLSLTETPYLDWEYQLITRQMLFYTHLKDIDNICEFGSGSGTNFYLINQILQDKNFILSDISVTSLKIIQELKRKLNRNNLTYSNIDIEQDIDLELPDNTAVITTSVLEQIGDNYNNFINFILKEKPQIVINVEPIVELLDSKNGFDNVMNLYCEKRKYLTGYLTELEKLEKQKKIKIIMKKRTMVSGTFIENSVLIWKVL